MGKRGGYVILGGAWKRYNKDGEEYLIGKIDATLAVMPNKFKKTDEGPDYNFVIYQSNENRKIK